MKLSIDKIKHKNNNNCAKCGIRLTDHNTSKWCSLISNKKNKELSVQQCVLCHEIDNRLLTGAVYSNGEFHPQKTKKECLEEIKKEGLTVEILKDLEEKSFLNINKLV